MRFLILFLCFAVSSARGASLADANKAYAEGNFAEARKLYEQVLTTGDHANAWFNHGNSSFRLNEPGKAALAYERALLAHPGHPEAAANLKFTRDKTAARVKEPDWLVKAWRYVAQPAASWVLIGEAWLGFVLIAAALLGRRSRALLAAGTIFALLGAVGLPALLYAREELDRVAVVTSDRVDARSEPADRGGLAETLPAASRVQIISEQGDWTYCELPGGSRGWVPAKSIERIVARSHS